MPIGVRVLRVKWIVIETLEILGWTTGGRYATPPSKQVLIEAQGENVDCRA